MAARAKALSGVLVPLSLGVLLALFAVLSPTDTGSARPLQLKVNEAPGSACFEKDAEAIPLVTEQPVLLCTGNAMHFRTDEPGGGLYFELPLGTARSGTILPANQQTDVSLEPGAYVLGVIGRLPNARIPDLQLRLEDR